MKSRQDQKSQPLQDQGEELSENGKKVMKVIELVESGMTERAACMQVGINRMTFRQTALRMKVEIQYARALSALAENQVALLETAIEDMREGKIDAQMAKVEIDARKWFASKFLPKRYGEKITQEISGPDGAPIAQTNVSLSPEQESNLAALVELAKGKAKK
jgi:hypothetical protein